MFLNDEQDATHNKVIRLARGITGGEDEAIVVRLVILQVRLALKEERLVAQVLVTVLAVEPDDVRADLWFLFGLVGLPGDLQRVGGVIAASVGAMPRQVRE